MSSNASNMQPEIFSTSNDDNNDHIKNIELIEYEKIQNQLNKWTIFTVLPSTIDKKGMFNFFSSMSVKTTEQTLNVSQDNEVLHLLNPRDLIRHRGKNKYMHLGLV